MSGSLLIVGSVAYDDVETPGGKIENALGGSALFSAAAASLLAPAHLVGVVGSDFRHADVAFLRERGVDFAGLEIAAGKTFHWSGIYETDLNIRHTLSTDLNVFADFTPRIPPEYRNDEVVFLGNIAPQLQMHVLDQMSAPQWVALDTMDLWIKVAGDDLRRVLGRVHMVIVNDSEARLLTGATNLITAARQILDMGPRAVVIKKGEHGVLLVSGENYAALPALPLEAVLDPTGAGDSFAGGMLGCVAATGDWSFEGLRRALAYGTATASLAVEAFSFDRLRTAARADLQERYRWLRSISMLPEPLV
jgi:sugar/nucleoside kinase (ribokinase family)